MSGSLNKFSPEIIKSGIFKNINNFQDFLNRISKTKEFNNRGIQKTNENYIKIILNAEDKKKKDKNFPLK